jgi:hypothetical protein
MNARYECKLYDLTEDNPNCIVVTHSTHGELFCLNNMDNDFRIDEIVKLRDFFNKIIENQVSIQNNKDLIDLSE